MQKPPADLSAAFKKQGITLAPTRHNPAASEILYKIFVEKIVPTNEFKEFARQLREREITVKEFMKEFRRMRKETLEAYFRELDLASGKTP